MYLLQYSKPRPKRCLLSDGAGGAGDGDSSFQRTTSGTNWTQARYGKFWIALKIPLVPPDRIIGDPTFFYLNYGHSGKGGWPSGSLPMWLKPPRTYTGRFVVSLTSMFLCFPLTSEHDCLLPWKPNQFDCMEGESVTGFWNQGREGRGFREGEERVLLPGSLRASSRGRGGVGRGEGAQDRRQYTSSNSCV